MTLIDDSKEEVENTTSAVKIGIWGQKGERLKVKSGDILAFKNIKVNEYKGIIQLNNYGDESIYTLDDLSQIKEVSQLQNWYKHLNIVNLNNISESNTYEDLDKIEHVLQNVFKIIISSSTNSKYYLKCCTYT